MLQYIQQSNMILKSLLQVSSRISQTYHKLKVTRLPGEETIVMIGQNATVGQLYKHIQHSFPQPNSELVAAPNLTTNLDELVATEQVKQSNEPIKDQQILPLLLSNDFFLYEFQNNKAQLLYGIQCLELSLTNNRHLPWNIQKGIIQLASDWDQVKTVKEALTLPQRAPVEELEEERQEINQMIGKTVANIHEISKLKVDKPLDSFVNKMSLLMGANWVFLYVVTFGYYGWDVGEPLSYLSAVGVDLLAFLKWYNLEQRVEEQVMVRQGKQIGLLNLSAQKRWHRWIHCYLRRHSY